MEVKNYSAVYRIMHWAIGFCMLFMLLTIFLRMNWMNRDHIASIITPFLAENNVVLSEEKIVTLAKQIRKPMWQWHVYAGYVLTGLYAIRLLLPFAGKMKFTSPFNPAFSAKEKFQYWTYLVFYGCMAVSLVTGLLIEFGPGDLRKQVEEVHALSIYYLLGFIFLHFGGVLLAEFTSAKGIISAVISGTKKKE